MTRFLRFEWERVIRRVMVPATVKHVALTLATYADKSGYNARPSVARLAATTALGERTVRRSLETLRNLGLVERTFKGSSAGRRAMCDVYRLTVPDDLFDRVKVLPVDEMEEPETPAIVTGDETPELGRSPVTVTCDEYVENTESPAPVTADSNGTPVTDARTPVTDDRNTGHRDHPPMHDHPTIKFIPSHRPPTGGSALAKAATS